MRLFLILLFVIKSLFVFSTDLEHLKNRFKEYVTSNLEGDIDKATSLYYNGFVEKVGKDNLYDGLQILTEKARNTSKNIKFEGINSISESFRIDTLEVVKIYFDVSATKEIGFQRYTRIALGIKTSSTDWKFICLSQNNPLFPYCSVKLQSIQNSEIRNSLYVSPKTKIRAEYYSSGEKIEEIHYYKNGDYEVRLFYSFCPSVCGGKYYNGEGQKVASYAEMDGKYSITKIYHSEKDLKDSIIAYSSKYLMKTVTIPVKKYDSFGRLIQHVDDNFNIINYEYRIGENGDIATMTEITASKKIVNYYHDNVIATKESLSLEDGSVLEKWFYDKNGLVIEYHKSTREITKYDYNEKDFIISENKSVFVRDGWKPWTELTYLYNSRSDLIEIKRKRVSYPDYSTIHEYEYEYLE